MASWKETKALYEVHENSKKKSEVYMMAATGNEIAAWCNSKNEANGYIDGLGGDKSYSCWAVVINY